MLSGDNQRSVDAILKQVGIDEEGNLLPDDKIARVQELTAAHKPSESGCHCYCFAITEVVKPPP